MWFWRRQAPLAGAPKVRRQKSYSGESGYVYQYFYQGYRRVRSATEFVFEVSSAGKPAFPVTVLLEDDAVASWETSHGRPLEATERYAVAKIALFRAFDERPTPNHLREAIRVRPADIGGILDLLGID